MFNFLILLHFVYSDLNQQASTYSFMNNQKDTFKLGDPNIYLQEKPNIFSRIFGKKTLNNEYTSQKDWYYIHFSSPNLNEIRHKIKLESKGEMLKNTFLVYLSKDELQKISNISLVKRLEPEDKLSYIGGPIEDVNHFLVIVAKDHKLPEKPKYYVLESKWLQNTYIVRVDRKSLNDEQFTQKKNKVIQILTSLSYVQSVSTYTEPTIKNNVATGFTQKNNKNFVKDPDTGITTLDRYFNNRQITGKDEIITVIDTLIDIYHSMFRDNNVPVTFNQEMTNHRKFVYYGYPYDLNTWISSIEENEHGTHVSGSAAGKNDCSAQQDQTQSPELFDGNAPDAKILYAGGLNNVTSSQQLKLMKNLHSKISTNSWGVDGFNDYINYEYGHLSYIDPYSIYIYAAGNEYESTGNYSVCDPGGSKNVLTIGALGEFYDSEHKYVLQNLQNGNINVELYEFIDAAPYLVGTIGTTQLGSSIVVIDAAAPGNNCNTIDQPQISLLYATNSDEFDWIYGCNIEKTLGILYTYDVSGLQAVLNAGQDIYLQDITGYNSTPVVTHASYSSTGPANKGILKPDVMAPGTRIISAKSLKNSHEDHGCMTSSGNALIFMQGTSMATPNAAGATALVRQFFRTNWSVQSVDLDGPTVRALIINSCVQQPAGTLTPNTMFGHGHIDLSSILPVDKNFGVQITHQIGNGEPSIKEYSQVVAKLNVKSNKVKLQITLSYLDPLINEMSHIPLTRDLDLVVTSSSGKVYKGDHLPNGDTQHFSTNEKVIVNTNEIEVGEYTIHIYSLDFLDTGSSDTNQRQNFSVVATGDIDDGFLTFTEATTCGCATCSSVHPLHCQCDNATFGEICQSKIDLMTETKKTYTVPSMLLQLVRIETNHTISSIGMFVKGNAAQHVEAFADDECHLNIGEYPVQVKIGQDSHKTTRFNFNKNSICVGLFSNNYEDTRFVIERDYNGPDDDDDGGGSHKKKLTKGQITGIVIGCICGAIFVIWLIVCCCKRSRSGIRDF